MDGDAIIYWLTWLNAACWGLCFWWMHRISSRQDAVLNQMREQGRRIERLSREEHDLIKEVHPQVGEISEKVQEVVDAVKENAEPSAPAKKAGASGKKSK